METSDTQMLNAFEKFKFVRGLASRAPQRVLSSQPQELAPAGPTAEFARITAAPFPTSNPPATLEPQPPPSISRSLAGLPHRSAPPTPGCLPPNSPPPSLRPCGPSVSPSLLPITALCPSTLPTATHLRPPSYPPGPTLSPKCAPHLLPCDAYTAPSETICSSPAAAAIPAAQITPLNPSSPPLLSPPPPPLPSTLAGPTTALPSASITPHHQLPQSPAAASPASRTRSRTRAVAAGTTNTATAAAGDFSSITTSSSSSPSSHSRKKPRTTIPTTTTASTTKNTFALSTGPGPAIPPPPPAGVPEKLGDLPLRLIIVGHNPSAHAWQSGHYYSNPSNHMWNILITTGIAPQGVRGPVDDNVMPGRVGVGFLDVGCGHPGTDSSSFPSEVFSSWSRAFYDRLRVHMDRAAASIGCVCGRCGAPSLVAFSGKRQYLELLNVGRTGRARVKSVEHGPQAALPPGWPLPPSTAVWVCSSTSGAAAMTRAQRVEPYVRLAAVMSEVEWPRRVEPACRGGRVGGDRGRGDAD